MNKKAITIAAIAVMVGITYFLIKITPDVVVTNFEECVAAGNPIMESYPAQCVHEGKTYVEVLPENVLLDQVVAAVKSGERSAISAFLEFGQFPCTKRDGMGGPPKCSPEEDEGTIVEALPVLAQEGFHIRKGTVAADSIVKPGTYYGQYRITDKYFGDADFPKGEYAIIITHEGAPMITYSILHIKDGKIVRVDEKLGQVSLEGLEPLETDTSAGWKLDENKARAAQMAVAPLSFPVNVVDVEYKGCEGCYLVTLQRTDGNEYLTMEFENWKIKNGLSTKGSR